MFKSVMDEVWAFDAEWVPDPGTGRALYRLAPDTPAREVVKAMWREHGATDEDPQPYLKLALCRVVSIAAVVRKRQASGDIRLHLLSLPRDTTNAQECSEAEVLSRFLTRLGERKPMLVGFNSQGSDLPVFVQRGIVNGIAVPDFCRRPPKPWEGPDYFARGSDWNIDLMKAVTLGGWGKSTPSLAEFAIACGIPGKLGAFSGSNVADAWLDGDLARIVQYNEHDALTTYLVWLRIARFAGLLTSEEYEADQERVRKLLAEQAQEPGGEHLGQYLNEWIELQKIVGSR